jgi:hypothetical protein
MERIKRSEADGMKGELTETQKQKDLNGGSRSFYFVQTHRSCDTLQCTLMQMINCVTLIKWVHEL